MTRSALIALAAAGLLVLAGCGSSPDPVAAPPAPTTTSDVTTTAQAVLDATEVACTVLAEDEELAVFWETVPKGAAVTAPFPVQGDVLLAVRGGLRAVAGLGQSAALDGVDPVVASAMQAASAEAVRMHDEVDATGMFDTREMTAAVSPVVTACMDAGVDMATG